MPLDASCLSASKPTSITCRIDPDGRFMRLVVFLPSVRAATMAARSGLIFCRPASSPRRPTSHGPGVPAGQSLPMAIRAKFPKVSDMHTAPVLDYLTGHGQRLDTEIAAATGISLAKVRLALSALAARGEIFCCKVTRYLDGKPVEGMQCRVAGYIPPTGPGRKPGPRR